MAEPLDFFQVRMLSFLQREMQLHQDAATWGFCVTDQNGERVDPQDVVGTNAGPPRMNPRPQVPERAVSPPIDQERSPDG